MGAAFNPDALNILCILKTIGLCTDLDTPKQRSDLKFDQVLSVFLKETSQKGKSPIESLPFLAIVGEGCQVDLLRMFCVVREKGGFLSVTTSWSWGDVAESICLEPDLGPTVKLVYVKYLSTLESWVQGVLIKKNTLDKGLVSLLKRKRDSTFGILNWVRDLAKNPWDPSNSTTITVLNEEGNDNKRNLAVDFFKLAVLIRSEIFLTSIKKYSSLMSTTAIQKALCAFSPNSTDKGTSPLTLDKIVTGQNPKKNPPNSLPLSWFSIDEQSEIPVGIKHQAAIPNYNKNKSYSDLDLDPLKYLGTRIWPLDSSCQFSDISPQMSKIGRKNCKCLVPDSIDCVRFHIAETRLDLKTELGPTFYKMGFHKMGKKFLFLGKKKKKRNSNLRFEKIRLMQVLTFGTRLK